MVIITFFFRKDFEVLEDLGAFELSDAFFTASQKTQPRDHFAEHSLIDACFREVALRGSGPDLIKLVNHILCVLRLGHCLPHACLGSSYRLLEHRRIEFSDARCDALGHVDWIWHSFGYRSETRVVDLHRRPHRICWTPLCVLLDKVVELFLKQSLDVLQEALLMVENGVLIFNEGHTEHVEDTFGLRQSIPADLILDESFEQVVSGLCLNQVFFLPWQIDELLL